MKAFGVTKNTLSNNTCSNDGYGFNLEGCTDNLLTSNVAINTSNTGYRLVDSCNNNTLISCNATNTDRVGFYLR